MQIEDALRRYPPRAVEGAAVNTIFFASKGNLRRPQGWFFSALKKGLWWDANQIRLYLQETGAAAAGDGVTPAMIEQRRGQLKALGWTDEQIAQRLTQEESLWQR